MRHNKIVSGFSDLKDLLIQKYNIKLHFSMNGGELVVHNHKKHEQQILLAKPNDGSFKTNLKENSIGKELTELALKTELPDVFLNEQFKLHGFFRS